MQIAEINWGDDSAERDQNLLSYFVAPFDYARLSRLEKPIVVGRKGAGKSALRKKLSADLTANQDFLVVECVPDYKVLTAINSDKDVQANFDSEIFFQYVWLTHLYSKAFSKSVRWQRGDMRRKATQPLDSLHWTEELAMPIFLRRLKT